ncbi:RNA polymerase sigma factor [Caulobacter segnis]|uniref:RNA polymerase sigma factor n=1 Tax=Caulobacter segnis TaxID=88688 RepID=UPI001CBBA33A|nr:RNA polymerase sigma factor [Caulobacter segnis]UAL12669.1 RNA polymerase sigma factor [Caulobacter segnis]
MIDTAFDRIVAPNEDAENNRGVAVSQAERPKLRIVREEVWRDHPAYPAVYAKEWRDLCAFLRARFGPGPPDCEDVAQQAFFKLGEQTANRQLESPRAFVFRIAINLMHDARRQLRRASAALGDGAGLAADADPDLERALIAKQQVRLLQKVLAGLPERHRQYLTANRVDGLSFAEIGRRHGVSESLVRKTVDEAAAVCQRAIARGTIDYRGLSRERTRRS